MNPLLQVFSKNCSSSTVCSYLFSYSQLAIYINYQNIQRQSYPRCFNTFFFLSSWKTRSQQIKKQHCSIFLWKCVKKTIKMFWILLKIFSIWIKLVKVCITNWVHCSTFFFFFFLWDDACFILILFLECILLVYINDQ